MNRYFIYFILLICLASSCRPALAFDSNSIVKNDVPYATLYRGTFDNEVMDFSLAVARTDTVRAISLKNLGSAVNSNQINYLVLWADSGPIGFQGLGIDRKIGIFQYSDAANSWYISNLTERITDSERFFVSAEIKTDLTKTATIQIEIPQLADNNRNASFDLGDFGIFMDSGDNGPTDTALANSNLQVISAISGDTLGPKISLTNLTDGQTINDNHFTIMGMARDQGISSLNDLAVTIDGQDYYATAINPDYSWKFDWQNISDGSHTISVKARDQAGNLGQTGSITVTEQNQDISGENSKVTFDKYQLKNDSVDKALITVTLKDADGQPIPNRPIAVTADPGVLVYIPTNNSDSQGQITAEIRASALGSKIITVMADSQVLKTITITVNLTGANFKPGDLIKASGQSVYYYGADAKRYVFPNPGVYFSWYANYNNVKIISNSDLASLAIGGNVTYKPGVTLVKITTDPKVYAVDRNGTLRWVATESLALSLYGADWAKKIVDVADVFFTNYQQGSPIEQVADYNPLAVTALSGTINADKGLN